MALWGAELGFWGFLGCSEAVVSPWCSRAPSGSGVLPLPVMWGRIVGSPEGAVKPRGVLVLLSGFGVPRGAVELSLWAVGRHL